MAGYQFCITIGILLANCVVYATQNRDDTGSYRIPIAVQFLWAIILAIGLFILPESPRYFAKKGKLESAAKALSKVRGQPIDSDYIQDELAEIIANHEYELQVIPQTTWLGSWTNCFSGSIFKGNSNVRRTTVGESPITSVISATTDTQALGILMQMMQQLTGMFNPLVVRLPERRLILTLRYQLYLLLRNRLLHLPRHDQEPFPHLPHHDSRQRLLDPRLLLDSRTLRSPQDPYHWGQRNGRHAIHRWYRWCYRRQGIKT